MLACFLVQRISKGRLSLECALENIDVIEPQATAFENEMCKWWDRKSVV